MPTDKTPLIIPGTNIKSPCKDCSDRFVGCHTVCVEYFGYKTAVESEKERYRSSKAEEIRYNEYCADRKRRLKGCKK